MPGTAGNDSIIGTAAAETINGLGGDDTIYGLGGDDSLIGLDGNDSLYGGAGNDTLNGGTGNDLMSGALGNDLYIVDSSGDHVVDANGSGTDTVFTSVSYALDAGQSIEIFGTTSVAGTAAINLTGNEFAQQINGNNGANIINGGANADTMLGYGGNDTYLVDNAGDRVFEAAGQGADTVIATALTYALIAGQSIEVLKTADATGTTAFHFTGNELAQQIEGNDGNNVLNGLGGGDTLIGYAGNDSYLVYSATDTVVEKADVYDGVTGNLISAYGSDTVFAATSYAIGAGQAVETLQTTSTAGTAAINLTGSEFTTYIAGNNGMNTITLNEGTFSQTHADSAAAYGFGGDDLIQNLGATGAVLDGGTGADTLIGGSHGGDIFLVDNAGDVVQTTHTGAANDTIQTTVSYALTDGQNIVSMTARSTADLTLTGNSIGQSIIGSAGNDTLNGGGGDDTLSGATGVNHVYGGAGADHMTGSQNFTNGSATEIFDYAAVSESNGSTTDVIDLLGLRDRFHFSVTPTAVDPTVTFNSYDFPPPGPGLNSALEHTFGASQLGAHHAVLYLSDSPEGHGGYLIVDANGQAGYQADQDYVVQLTNYNGPLTLSDFI